MLCGLRPIALTSSHFTTDLPHPYNKAGDGPEGPEARTVADKLAPILVTRTIVSTFQGERGKCVGFNYLQLPALIHTVNSYGKKILIHAGSSVIIVSLGMTGRLQYQSGDHSHISFQIADGVKRGVMTVLKPVFTLYFDDARYMGNLTVVPSSYLPTYLSELGPDVLDRALNSDTWIPLDEWISRFNPTKYPKRAICDVLMKQNLVAGIGNYLKSEILYYAGVLPDRTIGTLTTEEWDRIRLRAHEVIRLAYSHGGFTIESFISPDGATGNYPAAVYGKSHDPAGNPVVTGTTRDGRTSHWVPAIQQ